MENKYISQLKNLKLYKEDGQYYLDATYVNESIGEICEINVPKIKLPFAVLAKDEIVIDQSTYYNLYSSAYIQSGSCIFPIEKNDGLYLTIKRIEEKTKDMTIEEIEKQLGHKVRIVNKEK